MPKRILAINDNEETLELFRLILEEEGSYEVATLTYTTQILAEIHILDEIKGAKPDLIICDYFFNYQPEGWILIQKLKLDRDTADIPIVMCSAASREIAALAEQLAAKDISVLLKPFDIDELLSLVARSLGGSSGGEAKDERRKTKDE